MPFTFSKGLFDIAGFTMEAVGRGLPHILFARLRIRHQLKNIPRTIVLARAPKSLDRLLQKLLILKDAMARLVLVVMSPRMKNIGQFVKSQFVIKGQLIFETFLKGSPLEAD